MTKPQSQDFGSPPDELPPLPSGATNENPPDIGFWSLLREDLRTHDGHWLEPGFCAVAVHRFGNWRMSVPTKLLRAPFTVLYRLLYTWVHWIWGIKLDYTVKLGRRVRIWHHGGMILGARSIGNDVHIRQNTTFGVARRDLPRGKPVIEDRVDVGSGVCVLGQIRIGHDSVVGANAVVLKDVPPRSLVVGVPAKVIKTLEPGEETGMTAACLEDDA